MKNRQRKYEKIQQKESAFYQNPEKREDYIIMDINQKLTEEIEVKKWQVDAAVNLIDEGYTIPFISRYRKEVTGSLNDEQLRKLYERLTYLRNLEEKKNRYFPV